MAAIVDSDPVLMANDVVRAAVTQRFFDQSIAVRMVAVDLVGRFALLSPDLVERYFLPLAERLSDRGVSVRKAVVKILRDAMLAHPGHQRRGAICQLLVHRASSPKEEDTIKDLVRRTFEQLWFDGRGDGDALVPMGATPLGLAALGGGLGMANAGDAGSPAGVTPRTPKSNGSGGRVGEVDSGSSITVQSTNPKSAGSAAHKRSVEQRPSWVFFCFLFLNLYSLHVTLGTKSTRLPLQFQSSLVWVEPGQTLGTTAKRASFCF